MTAWYKLEQQTLTAKRTVVAVPQHENEYLEYFRTKNKVVMLNWVLYLWFFIVVCKDSLQRGSCLYKSRHFLSKVSPHDASSSSAFYYK